MKQYLILALLLAISFGAQAQKAKFKSKVCAIQKATLPSNYITPEKRTYQLSTKGTYAENVGDESGQLYGWTETDDNPHAKAVISIYGFKIGSPKKDSQKREKKDKDGKVTDSWTEYSYSNTATGLATLYVYGPQNKFDYKRETAEQPKEEKKVNDNPFLTQDIVDEAGEGDIGEDSGLDNADLTLVEKIPLSKTMQISTRYFRKSSDAYNAYKAKYDDLRGYRHTFPQQAYNSGVAKLNDVYGFRPVVEKFWIKTMKNDKHPESKTWNEAVAATQTIFRTAKFNKPMDKMKGQCQPIIDYFSNQLASLSPKDKKTKKHRSAAFNNLINIHKGLDQYDEIIAICNKYANDKKLDGTAKRAKKRAEYTKAHLAFMQMTDRHINTNDEIDESLIESEELVAEVEEEGN